MRAGLLFLLLAWTCAAGPGEAVAQMPVETVEVRASPINRFCRGSNETRFGRVEFSGGFEMRSDAPAFGQLSALRFLTPGADFIGVADHGYWFFGTIMRDEAGTPTGVADFRMQAMVGKDGRPLADKVEKDAEGLAIGDGIATVSFERMARVWEYALDPAGMGPPLRDLDFVIPRQELRYNRGMETVLHADPRGLHHGARIVIAERSIDGNGDLFAAILEGPERGVFKVRRSDGYDVTDGALLDNGDLLLLERRFSTILGVGVRLRRIRGDSVRKGALVDGPVLMEAGLACQIDNMEGLDVWRREDGELMISMLSDDNQSFLQRTIYLEFLLRD